MVDPLLQGYATAGNSPYTPGRRLAINDNSGADGRFFFIGVPELAAGPGSVEVDVQIDPGSLTLVGEETGVEVVLNYGTGLDKALRIAFIVNRGVRQVAFRARSSFGGAIDADWSAPTRVLIESIENPLVAEQWHRKPVGAAWPPHA